MTAAAFITGIGGQDGTYLAERLVADGMEVHALVLEADGHPAHCPQEVVLHAGDRPVLRAGSVFAFDRLDERTRTALLAGGEPIGHVLQGLDTRREMLARDCGEATAADELDLGVDPGELVHSRTYRILSGARPIAVVNERIPASVFDL